MPDGAVHDRSACLVQDRDARVNALMRQALESDAIKRFCYDGDFRRQVDAAAHMIAEQYEDKDTDEKIIQGILKAAYAIRKKVKVFVSYKKKYEKNTKMIVDALRDKSGSRLEIWYAHDITEGTNWMDTLFDRVTHAHWFLLLLPDAADDWGWQLYEAGIFRGSMLPGDRLICLHHPGVQLAPQIKDYQAVPAEQGAVLNFLEDSLVRPNAVPGMDPLHKDVQELDKLASKIVGAFDKLSAVQTRWFGNFVELRIENAKNLTCANDLNRAEIIATQGVQELFGRQQGVDQRWGELVSDVDPTDTAWITELVDVMRNVANGRLPISIEATFAGADGGAGKRFRPMLTSIKQKDGSIECFHVSFIEVLGRGTAGEEPPGMRSLQTAMRLGYRCRWEIIEPYRYKPRYTIKDIRTIENTLERLEREAHSHGLLDRGILCNEFGPDAQVVDAMYGEWEEIRNDQRTGLLDQGLAENDGQKVKKAVQVLADINKRFMILAANRFAEIVPNEW